MGLQQDADPNSMMFSLIPNSNYGADDQETKVATGYVQFIPICTSKESMTFRRHDK